LFALLLLHDTRPRRRRRFLVASSCSKKRRLLCPKAFPRPRFDFAVVVIEAAFGIVKVVEVILEKKSSFIEASLKRLWA